MDTAADQSILVPCNVLMRSALFGSSCWLLCWLGVVLCVGASTVCSIGLKKFMEFVFWCVIAALRFMRHALLNLNEWRWLFGRLVGWSVGCLVGLLVARTLA
jgi:hypothetical protein